AKLMSGESPSLLAGEGRHSETASGVIMGTVNYMSPEQAQAKQVDARTDIFSLGVILYELVAGRTPFEGASVVETLSNIITKDPPPFSEFVEQTPPPELRAIITRALQKDPAERYRAREHLLADLRSVDLSGADDAKTAALPQNIGDAARSTRDEEYATAELTAAGPRSAVSERLARNTADVPAKPESPGRRSFHIVGIVFAVVLLVSVVYFAASRYWTPATSINSVAVMPFVNESGDPASDYIGDGI